MQALALALVALVGCDTAQAQHSSACGRALEAACPVSPARNETACLQCVYSPAHQPALKAANCSSRYYQYYCSGGGHHREVTCRAPDPASVRLEKRPPVILIPPLSGSFMDWKMVNRKQKHLYCRRNADWVEFFPPSAQMALPGFADCYFDDASLVYDEATDAYSYPPGVEIRVNMTLESQCDPSPKVMTNNRTSFGCVCANLQAMGYTRYNDLRVYPYDWRLGPSAWMAAGGFFSELKAFIEKQSDDLGKQPVTAVGFSLGSPVFALFLQQYVTPEWKAQYIASFISISGVFGGTAETALQQLQASSSGGPPFPYLLQAEFASEQTFGSFSWMSAILPPLHVVATAGTNKVYTSKDLPTLYADAGFPRVGQQVAHAAKYNVERPIGVTTHAIFGSGYPTPQSFEFPLGSDGKGNFSAPCHYGYGGEGEDEDETRCRVNTTDGDNTGTRDSLAGVPGRWKMSQSQPVHLVEVHGTSHDDVQKTEVAMNYMRAVLVNTSRQLATKQATAAVPSIVVGRLHS